MKIEEMVPVEYAGQRLLTTRQLAEAYGTTTDRIKGNFNGAKKHFVEGVHYFKVEGEILKQLREETERVFMTYPQNSLNPFPKGGNSFVLYTLQGAARHAKLLNTKEAWEVFTEMEQFYFDNHPVAQSEDVRISSLEAEVESLKNTFGAWLEEMEKQPNPEGRADKLIALADRIKDDDLRDKILAKAANLLLGKNIF